MKRIIFAALTALSLLSATSCDQLPSSSRYEIKQDQSGRTIRLDKQTGEVSVVEGDKIAPLVSEAEKKKIVAQAEWASAQLAQSNFRPVKTFPMIGVKTASCMTMWRDGKIFFQAYMEPVPRPTAATYGIGLTRFRILFLDQNGFQLVDEAVPFSNLVNVSDTAGKKIVGQQISWSLPLSEQAYRSITDWSVTWLP
jgi:hypothetical protein